jgi:hypothetical protein
MDVVRKRERLPNIRVAGQISSLHSWTKWEELFETLNIGFVSVCIVRMGRRKGTKDVLEGRLYRSPGLEHVP